MQPPPQMYRYSQEEQIGISSTRIDDRYSLLSLFQIVDKDDSWTLPMTAVVLRSRTHVDTLPSCKIHRLSPLQGAHRKDILSPGASSSKHLPDR